MQIITLKWLESIDMGYEFIEVYKKHWPDSIPANQAILLELSTFPHRLLLLLLLYFKYY